jgi:hypothetical protein
MALTVDSLTLNLRVVVIWEYTLRKRNLSANRLCLSACNSSVREPARCYHPCKLTLFVSGCSGRSNIDPPCRFNIDPGRIVAFALGNCG